MADTTIEKNAIDEVRVDFSCPACGSEGYEESFDAAEIARATQVVIPCDDCSARILLDIDVRIQVAAPRAGGESDG